MSKLTLADIDIYLSHPIEYRTSNHSDTVSNAGSSGILLRVLEGQMDSSRRTPWIGSREESSCKPCGPSADCRKPLVLDNNYMLPVGRQNRSSSFDYQNPSSAGREHVLVGGGEIDGSLEAETAANQVEYLRQLILGQHDKTLSTSN